MVKHSALTKINSVTVGPNDLYMYIYIYKPEPVVVTSVPEAFKSFIAAKIFMCGIIRDSKWRAARCLKKTYNKETKNRNLISRVSKWRAARCLKKSIIREKQRIISLARKPFLTQLTIKDFF